MKSILYVGATLMIGASIYGFVDYKNTSHKEEFTGMYQEEKIAVPEVITEKKTDAIVTEKNDVVVTKNKVSKKFSLTKKEKPFEETVNGIEPIGKDEVGSTGTITIEPTEVDKKIADNAPVSKHFKKKKRINARIFSRAPIREEVYVEEKEVKKSTASFFLIIVLYLPVHLLFLNINHLK